MNGTSDPEATASQPTEPAPEAQPAASAPGPTLAPAATGPPAPSPARQHQQPLSSEPTHSHKRSRFEDAPSPGFDPSKRQHHGHSHSAIVPDHNISETVYRLLVDGRKVGSVIGKQGMIVKQIREDTGARIRVVEAVPNCPERCIVISSRNDPSRESSSAQEALYKVHSKVCDGEEIQPSPAPGMPSGIITRILVCHTQAGSIIGKGGAIIKEIRESSGAHIKILPPDELPTCALSNDRVVQLVGSIDSLQRALVHVSKQIRENPPAPPRAPLAPLGLCLLSPCCTALLAERPCEGPEETGESPLQHFRAEAWHLSIGGVAL